jgi:hypothetical protein
MKSELVGEVIHRSTVVHNYRFFHYLANEMAHLAQKEAGSEDESLNEYRYAVAAVVFSFTTIEAFFNHITHSKGYQPNSVFANMSSALRGKLERLSLPDKIEYAVLNYPDSTVSRLERGKEPFQSFDILRHLRNLSIHYVPEEEILSPSIEGYEVHKLEKMVQGRFAFNPKTEGAATVYRCFSSSCAKWSFELSQEFIDWLCDALSIAKPNLEVYWPLGDEAA